MLYDIAWYCTARCIDTLILMLGWVKTTSLAFPAHFKIHKNGRRKIKTRKGRRTCPGRNIAAERRRWRGGILPRREKRLPWEERGSHTIVDNPPSEKREARHVETRCYQRWLRQVVEIHLLGQWSPTTTTQKLFMKNYEANEGNFKTIQGKKKLGIGRAFRSNIIHGTWPGGCLLCRRTPLPPWRYGNKKPYIY